MGKRIIVLGVMIIMMFGLFAGCSSSHGLPNGTYHHVANEKDKAVHQGLEYAWQIKNDEAECLYLKYEIVEEEGKIYFRNEKANKEYEVTYKKKYKVLIVTVFSEAEVTTTLYKKDGLF